MTTTTINVSFKDNGFDCPHCGYDDNNYRMTIDRKGTEEPQPVTNQTIKCDNCDEEYKTQDMMIETIED